MNNVDVTRPPTGTIANGLSISVPCSLIGANAFGGVKAFGVMGLFVGPVVLSITLVVLEMLWETNLDYPAA